jgi:glyoxylase-like metal-dependent hydrolase (beta-lactamase superfamily II)
MICAPHSSFFAKTSPLWHPFYEKMALLNPMRKTALVGKTVTIGEIEITLLTDGVVYVDAGGPFGLVPRALYKNILMPDTQNMIPMVLSCLLVRAGGKIAVVDTGLGNKLTDRMKEQWRLERPEGDLIAQLAAHGISPEAVNIVIDTHLHGDHCAGNTHFQDDFSLKPTFPNAQYYVQQREYQDAIHPNERTRSTYYDMNFAPLVESGQMTLLEGDTEILPGVWGVVTPGHTPGHQSIRFESQGQHALFVADLASYAVHFERLSWMTSYDVEPLITLETKRIWQQWAVKHNALLLFQHDPHVRLARLEKSEDKLRLIPEPA